MDSPIAIQIKTFNRPERLVLTVESIRRWCDVPYRLYIGDDGPVGPAVAELYAGLEQEGHDIIRFADRLNVTTARNRMVARLRDEAFVLRLDDDFNFTADTRLRAMLSVLAARPEIGAMSGLERQVGGDRRAEGLSDKQGLMILRGSTLHKVNIPASDWMYQQVDGVRFAYANFTRNFLLIRRAVFAQVKWREELVIQGEHSAFMMDLQKAGWALAFTPDSLHVHDESPRPAAAGYAAARRSTSGRDQQRGLFATQYGVAAMQTHQLPELLGAGTGGLRTLRKLVRTLAGA